MRMLDPRNVGLLACCPCHGTFQTRAVICPNCENEEMEPVRKVVCADIDHNEPGGCGNPTCWKAAQPAESKGQNVLRAGQTEDRVHRVGHPEDPPVEVILITDESHRLPKKAWKPRKEQ